TAILEPAGRIDLPSYAFQRQRFWPQFSPVTGAVVSTAPGTAAEAGFWAAVESGDVRQIAETLSVDDDRLGELLPALAAWRRREQEASAVADWRYRVSWVPVPDAGSAEPSGTWLLVLPAGQADEALAEACTRALTDRGVRVVTLAIGVEKLE